MIAWLAATLAVLGTIVAVLAAVAGWGLARWRRGAACLVSTLEVVRESAPVVTETDWEGLPEPVRRYFCFALTPGLPLVGYARFEQEGDFRSGGPDGRWSPFTAVAHFATAPRAFVWDARIRMAPLPDVRVRDSYLNGVGGMHAAVAALFTVARAQGTPAMAAGALHRYLAEAVWLPTALLPRSGVSWTQLDDPLQARATLADGATCVSLDFTFDEDGAIVSAYTPARFRDVNGTPVPTPWRCHYGKYAPYEGVMLPTEGEVEWLLPEGALAYWRGRIVDVAYTPLPESA